tara:strand:- start:5478 stop:6731 length:1254 start_codon:yes stop_codon:yes gene_type:complete
MKDSSPQVLFLHTNYPAQFRFVLKAYLANNWDVWFASHTQKLVPLSKIKYIQLKKGSDKGSKLDRQHRISVNAFQHLLREKRTNGLYPDRIYVHTGWGLGQFLRDLFPNALIIAYSEWWFNLNSEDFLFDPKSLDVQHTQASKLTMILRNQSFSMELQQADCIISPTKWQKFQLPPIFRDKCKVIFDGIDENMFSPGTTAITKESQFASLNPDLLTLTYATRGLEPYRGFPEFVKAAAELLQSDLRWQVVIAGEDKINYHKGKNSPDGGYGSQALEYFRSLDLADRVHMVGSLPLESYRDLLRLSDLHCYFTRPYVLSWSLLESTLVGCSIFASNTSPVVEFLNGDEDTFLVDHTAVNLGSNLIDVASKIALDAKKVKKLNKFRTLLSKRICAKNCAELHLNYAAQCSSRFRRGSQH